jgi:hypothetical protein
MKLTRVAIAVALIGVGTAAHAQVFQDNFNSDTYQLSAVALPNGWTVSNGNVDVVGPFGNGTISSPQFGALCSASAGNMCVDLNGTGETAPALLQNSVTLAPGTYDLSFQLAGNQRVQNQTDAVTVMFGTSSIGEPALNESAAWTTYNLMLTTTGGATGFSFLDLSNNGVSSQAGALLDNVSISAVPEPSTYAIFGLGVAVFGAAGWVRSRRAPWNSGISVA